jgi:DNA-directed RNA polymerase specialized sigma24 family protein
MRVELNLRVQEALNGMAPHDREVLILRHFEELSNAEAARSWASSRRRRSTVMCGP